MNHGRLEQELKNSFVLHCLNEYLSNELELNDIQFYQDYYYWEKYIEKDSLEFLATHFFSFLKALEAKINVKFKSCVYLPQKLFLIENAQLKRMYPDLSFKQAIRALTQKYGAVFLVNNQVGHLFIWDICLEDKLNLVSFEYIQQKNSLSTTSIGIKGMIFHNQILGLFLQEHNPAYVVGEPLI